MELSKILNLLSVTNKILMNVIFVSVFLLKIHKKLSEFAKSVLILSHGIATGKIIVLLTKIFSSKTSI